MAGLVSILLPLETSFKSSAAGGRQDRKGKKWKEKRRRKGKGDGKRKKNGREKTREAGRGGRKEHLLRIQSY